MSVRQVLIHGNKYSFILIIFIHHKITLDCHHADMLGATSSCKKCKENLHLAGDISGSLQAPDMSFSSYTRTHWISWTQMEIKLSDLGPHQCQLPTLAVSLMSFIYSTRPLLFLLRTKIMLSCPRLHFPLWKYSFSSFAFFKNPLSAFFCGLRCLYLSQTLIHSLQASAALQSLNRHWGYKGEFN